MNLKYKINNGASSWAIEQAARIGSNMAIVYSVGPCSVLRYERDPASGRYMDQFPIYFDDYSKVAEIRHNADAGWLETLRQQLRARCKQTLALGMDPAFHFYEPQLPLMFEREYPELVGVYKRSIQGGVEDVHTCLDPDNPETWTLMERKYHDISRDFPDVKLFIITTGDIAGTYWGLPESKLSIADRLYKQLMSAQDGLDKAGNGAKVAFRIWWRNNPREFYMEGAQRIADATGLENAIDLMNPIMRPYNDPDVVLTELFERLPKDMPIMYKSTRMDIYENTPLTLAAGAYPQDHEQIIEISFELYHKKPWPWCKARHIRQGLNAVKEHNLSGYVSLPINMGNNETDINPESGGLGRMNTWIFEQLSSGDERSDRELLAAWLEKEFQGQQPAAVLDAIIDAEEIVDHGLQWGQGIASRNPYLSPHGTKLIWFSEGYTRPEFIPQMANPSKELIDEMVAMKHSAFERASAHLLALQEAEALIAPELYAELIKEYTFFLDALLLARDWMCYLLVQYGIEKGVYPASRQELGRMSRYVETFISNFARLKDTDIGNYVAARIDFPDQFALS